MSTGGQDSDGEVNISGARATFHGPERCQRKSIVLGPTGHMIAYRSTLDAPEVPAVELAVDHS